MKRRGIWLGAVCLLAAVGTVGASSVIGLSIEDQARLSRFVVMGQIVSQEGVVFEDTGLESRVQLRVTSVLKGDASRGDLITFHTRGGELDGVISEALGEARFRTGQRVLVFIEEVDGRLYNLGLSMGVWNVIEDRPGRVRFTRALQEGLEVIGDVAVERGPVSLVEMSRRVDHAARNPELEHPLLREAQGGGR